MVWVPNTLFDAAHYRIYRAVSNNPVNPLTLNYSLIASISSSTFEYTDYAVTILPGYQYAYYVVGWNGTSESTKTNYVSTPAEFHKRLIELPSENNLSQNFPNPFNPNTEIDYSIKETSLVKLKVYDILGIEVADLINETKIAGNHSVKFNASNLSSGVYFYMLKILGTNGSNFTSNKRMILMK